MWLYVHADDQPVAHERVDPHPAGFIGLARKSANQVAAEDITVKAYTALWTFMAGQAATRDVEAEFSPYMRNTRNTGTQGFLDQSESYVASINNQNMMATAVPKFTIQSSRDATPIENRPTVYVRGCADLSTTSIKNLETGATMPLNPSKDARVFTVEQFSDGWRATPPPHCGSM